MEITLAEIAQMLKGRLVGDPHLRIHGISAIEDAKAGEISFIANPKYYSKAAITQASALIAQSEMKGVRSAFLLVENPYYAFSQLLTFFHPPRVYPVGVDPNASIGKGVVLGEEVSIGPFAVLEDSVKVGRRVRLGSGVFLGEGSEIGEESLIYPNVTIREGIKIGKRVIIHSGTVVGSDGFGFAPHQKKYYKIPQVGGVIVEDDVELGANVTVDRGTLGNTVVGRGTKVDNLVQIGHNVVIGNDAILVAQVGISGSTKIGHHATLAGQVGVAGHLTIGDNVVVGGKSGVTKDIPSNENVSGFPPLPHKTWLKAQASFQHLPQMRNQLKALEDKIKQLEERLARFDNMERDPS
jgi:UDP-3-O-[3-hydroxymyristoyl] glucosamine N-acyltransferase